MNYKWMSSVLLVVLALVVAVEAGVTTFEQPFLPSVSTNPSSEGCKFVVAFMKNALPRDDLADEPEAYFIVTTTDPGVLNFTVTTKFTGMTVTTHHQVTRDQPTRLSYPADSVYVIATSETDKGIYVEAEEGKKISIYVVNDETASTDGFVALPCDAMEVTSFNKYNHVILSTLLDVSDRPGTIPRASQFMVIACEDDTRVTIRPTVVLSGGGVFSQNTFGPGLSNEQSNVANNPDKGDTLFVSILSVDLTGTLVRSDKPVVVISGHECGHVLPDEIACDHMATQIPPHTTWGYTFLLNPLAYRQSGDFYRFATLTDNTEVTITCVDAGSNVATLANTTTIHNEQGRNWGEFQTHINPCANPSVQFVPKYCSLQATEPVIVAQYSYGAAVDSCVNGDIGDPFMTLIPPVIQYLNSYIIPAPVNVTAGDIMLRHIGVSVHANYFDASRIFFDDAPLESNASAWQAIYCSEGDICGYATDKALDDASHYVYHCDENAAIFVHSYGFRVENSYALGGGLELQAIGGTVITCPPPEPCVAEGETINITCTRSLDLTVQSRIRVVSMDGRATAPSDYTTVFFNKSNILRFRGGNNMDSVAQFPVLIANDDDDEPEESFFISYERLDNALVIPSTTEVKICGANQTAIFSSVPPSNRPSIHPSMDKSANQTAIFSSVPPSNRPSIHPSMDKSANQTVIYSSVLPSNHPSIHPSMGKSGDVVILIAAIIIILVAIAGILLILATLILCYRRRMLKTLQSTYRRRLPVEYELKVAAGRSREDDTVEFNGEEDSTLIIPHYNSATSMDEIKEQNEKYEQKDADASEDRSVLVSGTVAVPLKDFPEYVRRMQRKDYGKKSMFANEYENIKKISQSACNVACLTHNRIHNRFRNIYPYDVSRVCLTEIPGQLGSDYINASLITGYGGNNYIAAQGPMKETVTHFWRMVWEYKIQAIVMLTRCFEMGKNKCFEYWPESLHESITLGDLLDVAFSSTSCYTEFKIRKFRVKKQLKKREKALKVTQFHYTAWPDHGVPENAMSLISFIRCVRKQFPVSFDHPLLVHCSAGIGRTGTFITLDMMMQQMNAEATLSVHQCVQNLRTQRMKMVQTLDQYEFIHHALSELVVSGETEVMATQPQSIH